jgi:DNA-binding NtrC family response regulator
LTKLVICLFIGDMPISQQTTLLRVLEYRSYTPVGETSERRCKARFVFATNRDLRVAMKEGKFREDLFYRINVAAIQLPALRQRPEDIPLISEAICARLGAEMGRAPIKISCLAMQLMVKYDWPGNVRELKNIIESAAMLLEPGQSEIDVKDLPMELLAVGVTDAFRQEQDLLKQKNDKLELIKTLKKFGGNQTLAAKALGVHRNTIRLRVRHFGLPDIDSV